ncbi:MAG TPA: ribosome biogenesis GTPase Der [Acidimicrobiales bacterium]|nr:ribosome biogenesis GTPase Der [Acidimicrobiales bacterium]
MNPVVAIVGRPNVGKSTLMNKIIGKRTAIVEPKPGVTRDRKEEPAEWQGRAFTIVDTGGWLPGGDALDEKVSRQSEKAMESADVVLFVVDVTSGVSEDDASAAAVLRKMSRPTLLVANKVDDSRHESLMWEFLQLGLGDPMPVSAIHGNGTGDLLDAVVAHFEAEAEVDESLTDADDRTVSVSIVGRPNVGKSTLFNRLTGDDRAVVHDLPGTTRDSIDTVVETEAGTLRFVDTAGMRRRARVDDGTEFYSVVRALQAVDLSNIALLVIDATVGVTAQDARLAERVDAAGCPVVVLLNKWELLDATQRADVEFQLDQRLHFVGDAPVLKISALTGKGVSKLFPVLVGTIDEYQRRVPTHKVNEVLRAAQQAQPAPAGARVMYGLQGATDPPTFTLFANRDLPKTYVRYLERSLREAFDLGTVPVKVRIRRRSA